MNEDSDGINKQTINHSRTIHFSNFVIYWKEEKYFALRLFAIKQFLFAVYKPMSEFFRKQKV